MGIVDIVGTGRIVAQMKVSGKKPLLEKLADLASARTGIDAQKIFDVLLEREKLGSTSVGNGIAIPHGRIEGLDQLYGFFIRLNHPIEYDSLDDQPVDLVIALIAPDKSGGDHLQALAEIARFLRDEKTCQALRQSRSVKEIKAILLADQDGRHS